MIENLIAFVLLAGIILIVSSIYIKASLKNVNLVKLDAIKMAHSVMEETIYKKDYIDFEKVINNKWTITRVIKTKGDRVYILVEVFKKKKTEPLAECYYIDVIH